MGRQALDGKGAFVQKDLNQGLNQILSKKTIDPQSAKYCIHLRQMAPRNCGLVTFLNNNKTRSVAEAARTLAHEVNMTITKIANI